jgi:protein-tyrosine kinase
MSRVFESLAKAKRAENGASEKVPELEWAFGDQNGRSDGTGVPIGMNGDSTPVATRYGQLDSGSKPWTERLEEFLFGWNLKRYKSYPIVALEKESLAGEQYKILREKLKRRCAESRAHCFCVMSPVKGDGKTLVAVNLAVATALSSEQQVLLIDADLRGPQVHHYFNIKSTPGLAEYLSSGSSNEVLTGYLHETFLPNLKILPAGKPTDFSSELLCAPKMQNLMGEIRSKFQDYQIIFDTPPLLTTHDPLVLAEQVDGIIVVARAGKTPHECLLESLQSLGSDKVIGMVLNDCELTASSKYYYYYRR